MDTPNTLSYMIAGYVVIFGGLLVYITSLFWRVRRLRQEESLLDETKE